MNIARMVVSVGILAVAGCGWRGDRATVAKAGRHTLSVGVLAETLARGEAPLRTDIAERWVWSWVETSLFADRVVAGDSLLDSATVVHARWTDVRDRVVGRFLRGILETRVAMDSAKLDSVYGAGELRWIEHILVPAPEDLSVAQRRVQRRRAERLRARLARGVSWERVRTGADLETRRRSGSLGVIARGIMVPEFEDVAFALEPGRISAITETTFGYHIIRRPTLRAVQRGYRRAIEDTLIAREHAVYREELARKWDVRLADDAPARVEQAVAAPLRAKLSGAVIGTYRGGRFTTADLVRWLKALPLQTHERLGVLTDEGLRWLADSLIKNELEAVEAQSQGWALSRNDLNDLKRRLARDVADVTASLGLDASGRAASGDRNLLVEEAVMRHLTQLGLGRLNTSDVPPALADRLRERARWRISYGRLDRALERAGQLRDRDDALSTGGDGGQR